MSNKVKTSRRATGVGRWLRFLLPFVFLLAAPAFLLSRSAPAERLQDLVFDEYQRLHPRVYEDVPVRVVDIDDESLARLGQWPWPRTLLAELVDRLTASGASAIAFDVTFPEPDRTSPRQVLPLWGRGRAPSPATAELARALPDHDQVFARSIARSRVVLASGLTVAENPAGPAAKASFVFPNGDPVALLDQFSGAVVNRPELEKAAAGNGSFTYLPDRDGIIRRVPLLARLRDRVIASLAAEALRVAQGADTIIVKCVQARDGEVVGINKIKIGGLALPTDENGRLRMWFTEPSPRRTIPAWKIMDRAFPATALSGIVIFIGTSASGLVDQRATPLSPITPGVELHAQVVEQAMLRKFLVRPDWAADAEIVWLVVLAAALILILQRYGAVWGAVFASSSIVAASGLSWAAYVSRQWLVDPLIPSLAIGLIFISFALVNYLQGERERREIRNAFRYYLSPELVDQLARHPENLKLGGEMRKMTFHFCDIEGFTSIAEFYDPFGLIHFLNSFLSPLTEVILKHHGTIDKYVGDCIVAFWNAPIDDPRHARNACLAAIEMHERLADLNNERRERAETDGKEFTPIRIRTGLNSGNCIVGNMGSSQRFSYSVLGDDVNLASRLEGANKFFGTRVMASEATLAEARDSVEARLLGSLRVAGKVVPVKVYELLARKGELSDKWRKALPLYEKGLKELYAREFEQAVTSFESVLEIFPNDGPSVLYRKMATDYFQLPPPEGWDGSLKLTTK